MDISIDDGKGRKVVDLEKKARAIKTQRDASSEALEKVRAEYASTRMSAIQGTTGWVAVGEVHIREIQLSRDFEKLNNDFASVTGELGAARQVFAEDALRALRAKVG